MWLYAEFEMSESGVTEWDLVCGHQWVVGMVSSLYMLGLMLGSWLVGFSSDRSSLNTIKYLIFTLNIHGADGAGDL